MHSFTRHLLVAAALAAAPLLPAQAPAASQSLTIDRLFRSREFAAQGLPSVQWMKDGRSYLRLKPENGGTALVRVDAATNTETVLAPASALRDADGKAIDVEDVVLSDDESQALLFHSSVRVWRSNTRGRYHVLDLRARTLTPIGTSAEPPRTSTAAYATRPPSFLASGLASGAADPNLLMFAKFSPNGQQVAFVRGNNLWVRTLATGAETQLTTDGTDDVINGTTDWVYEEELGLRDAFRWSPDSRRIAFWRFDQTAVPAFPMVDELTLYPRVSTLRYPKAGEANASVTLHVIDATGANRRALMVGPDTGQYVTRLEWVDADSMAVQRLPRKQNRLEVLMISASTGTGRTVVTDTDSAYVNAEGEPVIWLADKQRFLLRSDRSGWQQWYLFDRSGRQLAQITKDGSDALDVAAISERDRSAYIEVAGPTATQRHLMRCALDGRRCEMVTRGDGAHSVNVSPTGAFFFDAHGQLGVPPTVALFALPRATLVRQITDNAPLKARLVAAGVRPPELMRVPMPDGTMLDGYRIVPATFDSTRKHPVLMYAYGGPAAPQVVDAWGGSRFLWHAMLAQQGYVVVVVDNRGAAFRGRAFRKVTQYKLGQLEADDQMNVARWLGTRSWVDAGRIGFWGWSFGGYMASAVAARGGDLFRAVIAVAPVTDWRLYDSIYTERFMWTPQENAANYTATAPLSHVAGMRARFLLVHGTGDDNVHPQNSTQLVDRMVSANRAFSQLFYPNRTHSISGGNTTPHLYDSMTRFLLANL
jgi:dipeptidyl-peptidase 4